MAVSLFFRLKNIIKITTNERKKSRVNDTLLLKKKACMRNT